MINTQESYKWSAPQDLDVPMWGCEDPVPREKLVSQALKAVPAEEVETYFPIGVNLGEEKLAAVYGFEVGDDRVDFSNSPTLLGVALTVQESVYKMKTSAEDTFISSRMFNFTEVSSAIPSSEQASFDFCRKNGGSFSHLGYTDAPPLRTVLDVSKGDSSHSSSSIGKAAMMGARMRTTRKDNLSMLELASFLQDGMLSTSRSGDPKYLPMVIGGSSVPAPYGSAWNVFSYMQTYRGGDYRRLYGTAVNTARRALSDLERGLVPDTQLLAFLRTRGDFHRITYDNILHLPVEEHYALNGGGPAPRPIIMDLASANANPAVAGVISRLTRAREIVSQRTAEIEIEKTSRYGSLFTFEGRTPFEWMSLQADARKREAQEMFGGAVSANTAAQNLLRRQGTRLDSEQLLSDIGFRAVTGGSRGFSKDDARWLQDSKGANYSIFDLIRPSDRMYLRDEVSTEECLKIGGLHLTPLIGGQPKEVVTRTEIGRYQISSQQLEYARLVRATLERFREDYRPAGPADLTELLIRDPMLREWVEDDHVLAQQAQADRYASLSMGGTGVALIVSDDKKLTNRIHKILGRDIVQVSCKEFCVKFMQAYPETPISVNTVTEESVRPLTRGHPFIPDNVRFWYFDFGSIQAAAQSFDGSYDSAKAQVVKRKILKTTGEHDGLRYSEYLVRKYAPETKLVVSVVTPMKLRQLVGSHRLEDLCGDCIHECLPQDSASLMGRQALP